jgi:hypothetical protein
VVLQDVSVAGSRAIVREESSDLGDVSLALSPDHHDGAAHGQLALVQIRAGPLEAKKLPSAEPRGAEEAPGRVQGSPPVCSTNARSCAGDQA